MSKGTVNRVTLIGCLGADPEVKYMPSGDAVATIRVATTESWKDKQTGQQTERVEWHRIVFYKRLADIAGEYLKKGSKVYIEGSLRTQQWEKNGEKRYTTEVIGNEMQMLDRMQSDGNDRQSDGGQQRSQPRSSGQQSRQAAQSYDDGGDDFDSQIPF